MKKALFATLLAAVAWSATAQEAPLPLPDQAPAAVAVAPAQNARDGYSLAGFNLGQSVYTLTACDAQRTLPICVVKMLPDFYEVYNPVGRQYPDRMTLASFDVRTKNGKIASINMVYDLTDVDPQVTAAGMLLIAKRQWSMWAAAPMDMGPEASADVSAYKWTGPDATATMMIVAGKTITVQLAWSE